MSYATLADLVERAGLEEILQVADRNQDGTADPDVVEAALTTADERINAALATRYRLPLASPAPVVVGWAVSIARYHLHRQGQPDYVVRDWKDAISELDKAATGRIAVPNAEGLTPAPSSSGATVSDGTPPVFTNENLEGWL